jgi:hypothetical protein
MPQSAADLQAVLDQAKALEATRADRIRRQQQKENSRRHANHDKHVRLIGEVAFTAGLETFRLDTLATFFAVVKSYEHDVSTLLGLLKEHAKGEASAKQEMQPQYPATQQDQN